MSTALKAWFDGKRGRQRDLAVMLDVSESYLSNIANGRREGSVGLMRRIAEATGLPTAELMGASTDELRDDATPFTPRPTRAGETIDAYLAPASHHRVTWRATRGAPWLGILHGDLLVIDTKRPPATGEIVLASVMDGAETQTRILRYLPPYLLSGAPDDPPVALDDARVQGPIVALARGEIGAP